MTNLDQRAASQITVITDALLFDIDGVLLNSDSVVKNHWTQFAKRNGLNVEEVLSSIHGRRSIDVITDLSEDKDIDIEKQHQWLEDLETKDVQGIKKFENARKLTTILPPNRWAIVTSGSTNVATARLEFVGIKPPAIFITAEDVESGKPDPKGYELAAKRLGFDIDRCCVVEDAPVGIQAGTQAGASTIAISTTNPVDKLQKATYVVESLSCISFQEETDQGIKILLDIGKSDS